MGKRLGLEQSIGRSSFKSVAQNLFKDIVVQDSTMAGAGEWVTARQDFQVRGFSRANEPPVPSQPVFSQGANMSQQGQYQAGTSQPQNIAPQQTGVSASSANAVNVVSSANSANSVNSPFYLLAVGSSTGKLRGCEEDARQFARIMTTYLNIPGSQVKIITGASATLNGIKNSCALFLFRIIFLLFFLFFSLRKDADHDKKRCSRRGGRNHYLFPDMQG